MHVHVVHGCVFLRFEQRMAAALFVTSFSFHTAHFSVVFNVGIHHIVWSLHCDSIVLLVCTSYHCHCFLIQYIVCMWQLLHVTMLLFIIRCICGMRVCLRSCVLVAMFMVN